MLSMKVFTLLFLSFVATTYAGHWDYLKHGPSTWEDNCKGSKQSPIDIDLSKVTKGLNENVFFNHNYWNDVTGDYVIKNNGHALQIDLPGDTKYLLEKGDQQYVPLQIHIHFDPVTGKGSEHKLNSKKFFAEIHVVHRNFKYTEKKDIMGNSDGLLVLGMFVDRVKDDDDSDLHPWDMDYSWSKLMEGADGMPVFNDHVSFIMQVFRHGTKLTEEGQNKKIPAFPLAWLLPRVPTSYAIDYVNYKGSLTTPPCSEIVDWIVITGRTLQISEKGAKDFLAVKNSGGTAMAGNNRPVQPVNGRTLSAVEKEM